MAFTSSSVKIPRNIVWTLLPALAVLLVVTLLSVPMVLPPPTLPVITGLEWRHLPLSVVGCLLMGLTTLAGVMLLLYRLHTHYLRVHYAPPLALLFFLLMTLGGVNSSLTYPQTGVLVLLLLWALRSLLRCHRGHESSGNAFTVAHCIGIASLLFAPLLLLYPLFLTLLLLANSTTPWGKKVIASLVGVLSPFWIVGGLAAVGIIAWQPHTLGVALRPSPIALSPLQMGQLGTTAIIALACCVGNSSSNNHMGKLRMLMTQRYIQATTLYLLLLVVAYSPYFALLSPLLYATTALLWSDRVIHIKQMRGLWWQLLPILTYLLLYLWNLLPNLVNGVILGYFS